MTTICQKKNSLGNLDLIDLLESSKKENSAEKRSLSEIIGQKNINKKNNINKKMEGEKMEIERIAQNLSGPRSEELNQERKI